MIAFQKAENPERWISGLILELYWERSREERCFQHWSSVTLVSTVGADSKRKHDKYTMDPGIIFLCKLNEDYTKKY